ncbi:MAG: hypothetical protein JWO86_3751 [Myxococcaceae bacterium]|nr:hypothetical protein [Myxococcaceae bacterium]
MRRLVLLVVTCAAAAAVASIPIGCGDDPAAIGVDAATEATTLVEAGDAADADAGSVDAAVVAKGARVLGVSVVIGDLDFLKNVQTARDAGARTTNVGFAWDEIERPFDAGAGDASDDAGVTGDGGDAGPPRSPTQVFHPLLHVANLVLSDQRVAATVTIDALDVGGSRAPAELATLAFDDPELVTRYGRVLDYALDQLPDLDLSALFLASSADVPLGDDAAKHAAFATFVTNAAAHVHAARPNVKVGFVVTSDGAIARKDRLAAAWAASDVVGVTYLPIDAAAHVRPAAELPSAVASDLDALVGALPAGKPIIVREAGYPTAALNGGGEAGQVAFVSAVFGAWDRHATRIPILTFRELFDADPTTAAALAARYGHSDPAFTGFLQSLGLRTADRAKPGFGAVIDASRARGF